MAKEYTAVCNACKNPIGTLVRTTHVCSVIKCIVVELLVEQVGPSERPRWLVVVAHQHMMHLATIKAPGRTATLIAQVSRSETIGTQSQLDQKVNSTR